MMGARAVFGKWPSRRASVSASGSRASQAARGFRNRRDQGFSLVETLVALLIVAMVSVIVATGVPSAINAYYNAVASSNAQVALSTLTTVLRDELGSATKVELHPGSSEVECYWNSSSGNGECRIKSPSNDGSSEASAQGPEKTVKRSSAEGDEVSWTLIPDAQLSSARGKLFARFDSITYSKDKHVFQVVNLRILDEDDRVLARTGEDESAYLAIHAPLCVVKS